MIKTLDRAVTNRVRKTVVLLVLITLPFGCASDPRQGYSTNTTFPEDIKTIAVPTFESDSFTREVEFELTDAVIKEIEARTPYRVASSSRADSILLGRIKNIELDQLSKSSLTGLSEEMIISVSIDFQWKDLRTDTPLVERKSFEADGLFVPSRPTGEPIEIGQYNVVQRLARDIVQEMRSGW